MPSPTLARTHDWFRDWFRDYGPLISRILAALFGGYAVAALASVAVLALMVAAVNLKRWRLR